MKHLMFEIPDRFRSVESWRLMAQPLPKGLGNFLSGMFDMGLKPGNLMAIPQRLFLLHPLPQVTKHRGSPCDEADIIVFVTGFHFDKGIVFTLLHFGERV